MTQDSPDGSWPGPGEDARALGAELGPGERLLWTGRPRQGVFLRPSDWMQIPFSLFWGGFAFFWEWSVVSSNAPLVMRLWGIPFVLVGAYLIVGRFFVDARLRAKAQYAITSERAILRGGLFTPTTTSVSLQSATDVSVVESADGSGTITFGPPAPWWAGGGGWPGTRRPLSPAFDSIADVRTAYETLRRARQS